MMMHSFTCLVLIAFLSLGDQIDGQGENQEISQCLKDCLKPILKFPRTYTILFHNYEKICDKLEKGAYCSRKCSPTDQRSFYHYTTFHRLHCVEFANEIEEQLECLKEAASIADQTCTDRCASKTEKMSSKEQQMKNKCKTLDCSFVCFYEQFSNECPDMQDTLMEIGMRQVDDMKLLTSAEDVSKMGFECRQIHDKEYMRKRILGLDK